MKDLSHAQSRFLRAFNKSPAGPPPDAWPSPLVFQRWLAHPPFRAAYRALRSALKAQLELRSLCAALAAHEHLHPNHTPNQPEPPPPAPATPAAPVPKPQPPAPSPADPSTSPVHPVEPPTAETTNHESPEPGTPNLSQRLAFEREKLAHRAALTFLRLAHARLIPPPRRSPLPPLPPKPEPDPEEGLTDEEIAVRRAHPDCRPEVAIAQLRGDLHPFYDEHEYDMTTNPPTLLRLNPRCPRPPLYAPRPSAPVPDPGPDAVHPNTQRFDRL